MNDTPLAAGTAGGTRGGTPKTWNKKNFLITPKCKPETVCSPSNLVRAAPQTRHRQSRRSDTSRTPLGRCNAPIKMDGSSAMNTARTIVGK